MKKVEQVKYTAEAVADYGREGTVSTSDGALKHALVKPVGMGGRAGEEGVNPEQLFAAGYSACFHASLLHHARRLGVDAEGTSVRARVSIGTVDSGGYGLAVEMIASLPGVERKTAESLAELAHEACPYSRATRGNIEVVVTVET